jgi:hypothetical protein
MGNGSSSVTLIKLDRIKPFYFTDEIISGTVASNFMQGRLETDRIYIEFTGVVGYKTNGPVLLGRPNFLSVPTVYRHVPVYTYEITFSQSEHGQRGIVSNPGLYLWPFQIPLISHLPPTINQPKSYPHVRYYLQVIIHRPGYKPYIRETKYVKVHPRVNLLQNPECLQATEFRYQNRKDITLKAKLNRTGYVPGETIQITLKIENPRQILIQHIDFSLVQAYRIENCRREYPIFQKTLPIILNIKDEQITETFSIIIPTVPLPPTYTFPERHQRFAFVNIRYMLKLAVKVNGIFNNFDIDMPIKLGTQLNPDLNDQQRFNPMIDSYSSNSEQSDDDLPPDYDFVMQNMN